MVVLQAANQGKVYVHKALLEGGAAGGGGCTWSCFPSSTVTSFVEYLYQGDYDSPAVLYTSLNPPEIIGIRSTDAKLCE